MSIASGCIPTDSFVTYLPFVVFIYICGILMTGPSKNEYKNFIFRILNFIFNLLVAFIAIVVFTGTQSVYYSDQFAFRNGYYPECDVPLLNIFSNFGLVFIMMSIYTFFIKNK